MQSKKDLLSWKHKLWFVSAIPLIIGLLIGAGASYILYTQGVETSSKATLSVDRQVIVSLVKSATLDFERAIHTVTYAQESDVIRQGAIEAIRSSSIIDESLQRLKNYIPDEKRVDRLQKLLVDVRGSQLRIIHFSRENLQSELDSEITLIKDEVKKIINLTDAISADEIKKLRYSIAENRDHLADKNRMMQIALGLCFLLGIYLKYTFSNLLLRPLIDMTTQIKKIASGNMKIKVPVTSKDELGGLASGINQMVDSLHAAYRNVDTSSTQTMDSKKPESLSTSLEH